jgi:hypothetical protein
VFVCVRQGVACVCLFVIKSRVRVCLFVNVRVSRVFVCERQGVACVFLSERQGVAFANSYAIENLIFW